MSYAAGTTVPVLKSRIEIEGLLRKYGATKRAVMEEPGAALVYFEMQDRVVQFRMPLPTDADANEQRDRHGYCLSDSKKRVWLEQREREQWRGLLLVLKAKFTALETKVETFEECFLAHIVMPGGETVSQKMKGIIATAYGGTDRPMLTAGSP